MLSRRDALKLMAAAPIALLLPDAEASPKKRKRSARKGWIPMGQSTGGGRSSPPYQRIWGLGSSYMVLPTADRLTIFSRAKDMGCTWVKDNASWANFEATQGTLHAVRLAQLQSAIAQAHALGLRYYVDMNIAAPTWATGGGGAAYPTNAGDLATFSAEAGAFYEALLAECDLDAISVGHEFSGPDAWNPDGVAGNKTPAAACAAYKTFYDTVRPLAKAARDRTIIASSAGDSDIGYVNNWATTMSRLGFWPDWYCIYDYRFSGAYPYSWDVPEENTQSQTQGTVTANLAYYQALFPGLPIVITETGYVHGGTRAAGRSDVTENIHASLYCRIAAMAAAGRAQGVFFHDAIDENLAESGVMTVDYKPRQTYTSLKALLNHMPRLDWVRQSGAVWTAGGQTPSALATWNTTTDHFTFSYRGYEMTI